MVTGMEEGVRSISLVCALAVSGLLEKVPQREVQRFRAQGNHARGQALPQPFRSVFARRSDVYDDTPEILEPVPGERLVSTYEHDEPCVPQFLEHPQRFPVCAFAEAADGV